MSQTTTSPVTAVVRSPILWGGLLTVGFYGLIHGKILTQPIVVQYTTGHPIEYVTMAMFFIALVVLLTKLLAARKQSKYTQQISLSEVPPGGQLITQTGSLLDELEKGNKAQKSSWYGKRLRAGLEFVKQQRSAEKLPDELRRLAEADLDQQYASYGLLRVIIWAIPILGFLGTVMGITLAIAHLEVGTGGIEEALKPLTEGLATAFDTTALALALSLVLMFAQYLVDQFEMKIFESIEEHAHDELTDRFEFVARDEDPMLRSVRRMVDAMLATTDQLVERQAKIWEETILSAKDRWEETSKQQQGLLEATFSQSLNRSLELHLEKFAALEDQATARTKSQWEAIQSTLKMNADLLATAQKEHARHSEVLIEAVKATGEVTKLETALNKNLHSLSQAGQFEESMITLSAVLQLLSARLGASDEQLRQIHLPRSQSEGNAA
ncbi:Hypothetical protein PBC10988_5350 [Planctomycetales bacterium 10988]|nr:Hypothetical protein PBC10988_5350 [Planctomycetales bacterium 10988]